MDERSNGKGPLVGFILIAAVAVGIWYFMSRPSTVEAVNETVDVFVPDRQEFNRRTSVIDEARQVTDLINSRSGLGDSR